MNEDFKDDNSFNLVNTVISNSDGSFKEKPYARLKDNYKVNSSKVNAENYLIESCERRSIWPIELLLNQFCKEELSSKISYITDCGDKSRFDPPRNLSELRTEKCAYFAGIAAGDGGFNGPKTWSVVDGGKEHQLDQSREFIQKISQIMQELFGFQEKSIWINKKGNRFELKITNKWFSRYIRNVFDLPKSYKKGKLSRPDVFNSNEKIAAFWRGVFDTDGSISKDSYRISMGTATESFAIECLEDLDSIGISANLRNASNGYEVRVETTDFERFCNNIGFSHPRKREMMLSKLKKGSRNYVYKGRLNNNLRGSFYDLTKLNGLRIIGFGDRIRQFREEKEIYQKDLANQLGVSTNKIWHWENEECAAPVEKIEMIFGSALELLKEFVSEDVKFKMGVRGNQNSLVKLPIKQTSEIDVMASNIISTKNELRIRDKDSCVATKIESKFDTEIRREEYKLSTKNQTVINFFSKFYSYEPTFSSYSLKEVEEMRKRLRDFK